MAGLTWINGRIVSIDNLPELAGNPGYNAVKEYAKQTNVSEAWLQERFRSRRPNARSFLGIPVEVKGKLWGVIILDSIGPDTIKYDPRDPWAYNSLAMAIGKLMERE